MSSVSGLLMKGSLWISGGRAIVNALTFLNTIILARLLTPSDFGLVAIGTAIFLILSSVTEMSLSQALIRQGDLRDDHFHVAWTLGLLRGLFLAALIGTAAYPLALLYREPRLEEILYALALCMFISGLSNPRRVLLSRQLIFWQDSLISVSQKLTQVLVSILVAVYFRSYWAIIWGMLAGQVVAILISYTILPLRPKFLLRGARDFWSFSVWLTLGQAINTINWRFDQLLIGQMLGRMTLGYYAVGDNLAQMPTREVIAPLTQTVFPALSRLSNDKVRLVSAYQRCQTLVTAVALPAGIGCALVADPLIRAAMGEKWAGAIPVVQALSAVFAVQTLGSLVQPLGMAKGATRMLFQRDLQMFFLRLPVVIGGMLVAGLPGLLLARVVMGLVGILFNMSIVRKLTGLALVAQLLANTRAILAAIAMVLVVLAVERAGLVPEDGRAISLLMHAFVVSLVGALAYIGITAFLWHSMGRPEGPETEMLVIVRKICGRKTASQVQ